METFVQTNDGKYACYRYKGLLHYGTPEELAKQYGIPDDGYEVELDQGGRRPLRQGATPQAGPQDRRWG